MMSFSVHFEAKGSTHVLTSVGILLSPCVCYAIYHHRNLLFKGFQQTLRWKSTNQWEFGTSMVEKMFWSSQSQDEETSQEGPEQLNEVPRAQDAALQDAGILQNVPHAQGAIAGVVGDAVVSWWTAGRGVANSNGNHGNKKKKLRWYPQQQQECYIALDYCVVHENCVAYEWLLRCAWKLCGVWMLGCEWILRCAWILPCA